MSSAVPPESADPQTIREANAAAMRAMAAGDFAGARETLRQALALEPRHPSLWLNLAACCRALEDVPGALAAIEDALRVQPRSFAALLMKGSMLERLGRSREAASIYGFAIGLAPPEERLDAATRAALAHAREVRARHVDELSAFVEAQIGGIRDRSGGATAQRINTFVDIATGRRRNYRQEPTDFFYPGLPELEFHPREDFPWLQELEAATAPIREELRQVLREDLKAFVPYIDYAEGLPLDQWAELNRSARWSALHFYHYGKRIEENCRRCPQTMRALTQVPQPLMPGRSPAAMFSALQPRTRIPPHTGVANTRLVVHLPLIVPQACGFRVGNQTRAWREGAAWVFDDTIEHEAWNDSPEPRFIFICDIWNPLLDAAERELIVRAVDAIDRFNGVGGEAGL